MTGIYPVYPNVWHDYRPRPAARHWEAKLLRGAARSPHLAWCSICCRQMRRIWGLGCWDVVECCHLEAFMKLEARFIRQQNDSKSSFIEDLNWPQQPTLHGCCGLSKIMKTLSDILPTWWACQGYAGWATWIAHHQIFRSEDLQILQLDESDQIQWGLCSTTIYDFPFLQLDLLSCQTFQVSLEWKKNGDMVVTCCDPIPMFLDDFRVRLYKFILSVDFGYVSTIWQLHCS